MDCENEQIIIFGAGYRKDIAVKFIEKYGGFEVVEVWDNNKKLSEKRVAINNKEVEIRQPHSSPKCNIVIVTDIYFDEINRQLVCELGIDKEQIKRSSYLFKNFKQEILRKYCDSKDGYIIGICRYLQEHDLDMFNGQVKREYSRDIFNIQKDTGNGLMYSYWMGKRIYLSSGIKNELSAKEYLCSLCREQDEDSPHSYHIDKLNLDGEDIVIDGGAAEGFFALQIIDRVKRVYLVEGDEKWVEALKYTFKPYNDKVVIIPKLLDSRDSDTTVSIDHINGIEKVTLIKLDIEGAEQNAIAGGENTFSLDQDVKVVVCTYHNTEDADVLNEYFMRKGFETGFSKGYLFVGGLEIVKPELRRGVLSAGKGKKVYV